MLGINLLFAGFALTLNGVSYLTKVDDKAKAAANILVGVIIAVNAVFQTAMATDHVTFGFSAAMWLFALNYFIIATHIIIKADSWKVFGLYGFFASVVSLVFAGDTFINNGPWEMVYMWLMWAVLWAQSFFAIMPDIKAVDKFTPHILIINGIASTFIPGLLILLGIIL
ncbi:MAG: AmiS/UreI family transporter [Defluviitaleaceae bacterium]|nr:AmiS/UreI family transporter [Defluviitaleaceae bacterium]